MEIYPKEILNFTFEVVHKKHKVKSSILYKTIMFLVVATIVSLPFIIIDLNVQSAGIIETHLSQYLIKPQTSGVILINNMEENADVNKGDTLLVIETSKLRNRIKLQESELKMKQAYLQDLTFIHNNSIDSLSTNKYVEDYQFYKSQYFLLELKLKNEKKKFWREEQLFNREVTTEVEYEKYKFDYDQSKLDLKRLVEQNTNRWAKEYDLYLENEKRTKREISNLEEQIDKSIIISPIDGTINGYKKIEKGAIVFANQQIAEISPKGELIAELYITPKDIGLVNKNMEVLIQIDAFNYNQWGSINGQISEVSNDVIVVNKTPMFKAKCKLQKDFLVLKNGYVGKLKKGMSLRSRIKITERSLFDLLYDKIDDWVNPNNSI